MSRPKVDVESLVAYTWGDSIGVESQIGSGSTFWFELPAVTESPR